MGKREKKIKIAAIIALIAILWSVVGTWAMVIYETITAPKETPTLSQEELQNMINTLTPTQTASGTGEEDLPETSEIAQ